MLKATNLKLDIKSDFSNPTELLKRALKLGNISSARLVKRSLDARKRDNIHFVCTFLFEVPDEKRLINKYKNISLAEEKKVDIILENSKDINLPHRPIVIGSGPAGLFCALTLAKNGLNPLIIERGDRVEERHKKVAWFWSGKELDEESNVQFGEGGAGTFSDGKLNTGTKDSLISFVLREFYENGAKEDILYNAKPHIGTDVLRTVVKNLRDKIIALGGEFRFNTKLTDIVIEDGKISAVRVVSNDEEQEILCSDLVLAIGHSARDTLEMLKTRNLLMEQKPFSVGVRIEHPQSLINKIQYKSDSLYKYLGAADYKTAVHLKNGRSVYSFCMCPGGYVVASASEKGGLVTNGMSEQKRDAENANSALLVGVNPSDFSKSDVFSGIKFQRELERKSFEIGGSSYFAPVMTVADFIKNQSCRGLGSVNPSYRPGVTPSNFNDIFPDFIYESLRLGILEIDKKMKGFLLPDAVLTAVESRSSSPVRIVRDETAQSNIRGIYPCGEGSGYSGGITSSAVDGIKSAKKLIEKYML